MKKIIGFFPKIRFISNTPNIKFKEQEGKRSKLIQEYGKEHPTEFIWTVGRNAGDTVYAQPRSELKKQTDWEYYEHCKQKGILYEGRHIPNPLRRR